MNNNYTLESITKSLVMNRDFWQKNDIHLHVDDKDYIKAQEFLITDDPLYKNINNLINVEGYFQLDPPDWNLPLESMSNLVSGLVQKGLPAPFAFVYDEFWLMFIKMNKIIESIMGPNFKRLPDFWVWHIDPKASQSGWSPHRDKDYNSLHEDGSPKSLTIWLPLTQSTPLNGCMYIVPAYRDPTYGKTNDKEWKMNLQDIRALPALAGSILCWNQAVFHWGSHASEREKAPRISISFEFQAANIPPMNKPLMDPYNVPDLESRIILIAKQILQYKHMYPLSDEIRILAESLMQSDRIEPAPN